MSQVELPQLSLQRYVDLVKRRRWQLVPVSALGLLVGGFIAFLIPRYFVADTLLEHQRDFGKPAQPGVEDPLAEIVDTAKQTIPQAVLEAMLELKWPEATITDPFERTQKVKEVQSRIAVADTKVDRGRSYAQIRVFFRDLDGERAATFLNTLVDVWSKKRVREIRDPEEAARKQANELASRWGQTYDVLLRDRREIETRYGLRPNMPESVQSTLLQQQEEQQRELRDRLSSKEAARAKLTAELAAAKESMATMRQRVEPDFEQLAEAAKKTPEGAALFLQVAAQRLAMENSFAEGSKVWLRAKRNVEAMERMLRTMVLSKVVDEDGLMPNPKYEELRLKILADTEALAGLTAEVERLRTAAADENRRLEDMRVGFNLLDSKRQAIAEAQKARANALAESSEHEAILAQLESQLPVRQTVKAVPPPRPTDPNIMVVALIGCVLGLGVAIGLILLLDFVQGSFKTADDVERGLAIPVLGGISHLETEEETRAARAGRRRASVAAFGVVALVVFVVTIFYIDPTRLPPAVRDLLSMLLGS